MNSQNGSKLKPQLVAALIVFFGVIILGYLFRNILQESVLVSLQNGLWWGDFFIKLFGQKFFWVLILVVTLGLALQFSRVIISIPEERPMMMDDINPPDLRRIDFWKYRIFGYRKVRHGGNYFLLEFPKLIIDTLAFHEGKDTEQIKAGIISGEIDVPEVARSIVRMEDLPQEPEPEKKSFQWVRNLIQHFQGRLVTPAAASDSELEKLAVYLEKLLEDENDN